MSIVVIATVGAANANSFQTVAEIDLYFEGRVPSSVRDEWIDADEDDKDAAAVMATTWMTALINFTGWPTTTTQSLPFPRNSLLDRGGLQYISDSIIPRELKNAHAEFARLLLLEDRIEENDIVKLGLQKIKAGPVDIQFLQKYPVTRQPAILPNSIIKLLVPSWIESLENQTSTVELARY